MHKSSHSFIIGLRTKHFELAIELRVREKEIEKDKDRSREKDRDRAKESEIKRKNGPNREQKKEIARNEATCFELRCNMGISIHFRFGLIFRVFILKQNKERSTERETNIKIFSSFFSLGFPSNKNSNTFRYVYIDKSLDFDLKPISCASSFETFSTALEKSYFSCL